MVDVKINTNKFCVADIRRYIEVSNGYMCHSGKQI